MPAKSTAHKKANKHRTPNVRLRPEPVIARTSRDRSEEAEKKRASHITMDFLGVGGLFRALVNYATKVAPKIKSSKGTAAKARAEPFRHYYQDDPDRMRAAFVRHLHPRSKRGDKAYCDAKYAEYLKCQLR